MIDTATSHWIVDAVRLEGLLDLAAQLGTPIPDRRAGPICEELQPLTVEQARPRSISAMTVADGQAFHSDGAQHRTPPSFVLLHCVSEGDTPTPTLVLPFDRLALDPDELSLLRSGRWSIRGGRGSNFYRPAFDDGGFRYDPHCMCPANTDARKAHPILARAIEASTPTSIELRRGQTLVIRNHIALHGRGRANDRACGRILCRVLVRERAVE